MLLFVFNGLVFLLLGVTLPPAIVSLVRTESPAMLAGYAIGAVGRSSRSCAIAWVYPGTYLPVLLFRRIREREAPRNPRAVFLVGWAGLRGSVTMAAALSHSGGDRGRHAVSRPRSRHLPRRHDDPPDAARQRPHAAAADPPSRRPRDGKPPSASAAPRRSRSRRRRPYALEREAAEAPRGDDSRRRRAKLVAEYRRGRRATPRTPNGAPNSNASRRRAGGWCLIAIDAERRELASMLDAGLINDETRARDRGAHRPRRDDRERRAARATRMSRASPHGRCCCSAARSTRCTTAISASPTTRAAPSRLPQVRLLPAGDPPHRPPPGASAAHRLAMLELADRRASRASRSTTASSRRAGKSYTVAHARRAARGGPASSADADPRRRRVPRPAGVAPLDGPPRARAHRRRGAARRSVRRRPARRAGRRCGARAARRIAADFDRRRRPAASTSLPIVARDISASAIRAALARGGTTPRGRARVAATARFGTILRLIGSTPPDPERAPKTSSRNTRRFRPRGHQGPRHHRPRRPQAHQFRRHARHRQRGFQPPGQGARPSRARQAEGGRRVDHRRRGRGAAPNGCSSTPATSSSTSCSPPCAPTTTSRSCGPPARRAGRRRRRPRDAAAPARRGRDEALDRRARSPDARVGRRGRTTTTRRACRATGRSTLVELKPEPRDRGRTVAQLLDAESRRLDAACAGATIVALDERGRRVDDARIRRPPRALARIDARRSPS